MNTHNRLFALQVSFFALCLAYSAQLTLDATPKLASLYGMPSVQQPTYVRVLHPAAPTSYDASATAGVQSPAMRVHTGATRSVTVSHRAHTMHPSRLRVATPRVNVATHTSTLTSPNATTAK